MKKVSQGKKKKKENKKTVSLNTIEVPTTILVEVERRGGGV